MRTIRTMVVTVLVSMLALTPSAFAQERHAVNPSALAQAVTQSAAQQDADRATVKAALQRPEVRDVATRAGFDLDRMQASVDTLEGAGLAQAAAAASQVNQALVGGASTVVISTTTIIVALLIVILIVVAVD